MSAEQAVPIAKPTPAPRLTPREIQVIRWMHDGFMPRQRIGDSRLVIDVVNDETGERHEVGRSVLVALVRKGLVVKRQDPKRIVYRLRHP